MGAGRDGQGWFGQGADGALPYVTSPDMQRAVAQGGTSCTSLLVTTDSFRCTHLGPCLRAARPALETENGMFVLLCSKTISTRLPATPLSLEPTKV